MTKKTMGKELNGFTLIEVLLATAIFAFSVLALSQTGVGSLRKVRSSSSLFTAVQLAQSKMTELEFKYQKQIDSEGVKKEVIATEEGVFDDPFSDFRWKSKIGEPQLQIRRADLSSMLSILSPEDPEAAEAMVEDQGLLLMVTNINKVFKENFAELSVVVEWESDGRSFRLPLVTHLIPKRPKIQTTTQIDVPDGEEAPQP